MSAGRRMRQGLAAMTSGVNVVLFVFGMATLQAVSAPRPETLSDMLTETKIYISTRGSDANPGTARKPLKSIGRALEVARDLPTDAPREIVLADGVYEVEAPVKVTSEDIDVTIRAANRGKAIISGSVPVTAWTSDPLDPGVFSARLPFKPEPGSLLMLFDNGEPCELATYPKKGRLHYKANAADGNYQWLGFDPNEFPAGFEFGSGDLESIWVVLPQEWAVTQSYVDEVDSVGHRLHMKSKSWMVLGKFNQGYTLSNTRLGMSEPGAWMYESGSGRILYRPRAVTDSKLPNCRLTRQRCLFDIRGVQTSFALEGLVLEGCCVPFVRPNIWSSEPLCGVVSVRSSRRVALTDCEIRDTAGDGVMFLKADTCKVEKCNVHNTGGSCVSFVDGGVGNIEVSGCELHHGGILTCAPLLSVVIPNAKIVGNHIHDGPGRGAVLWSSDSLFADNHIHHVMKAQRDGGGLYGGYSWTIVKGNKVHDTYGWPCLYADEGSQHSVFTQNTCEHWWPTHMHCTRFCSVTNNVFICKGSKHRFSFQGSGGGVFSDNRLLLGTDVKESDYISLEACSEWARNEVILQGGDGKRSVAKKSFKTGMEDPKDPLFVCRMPDGADPSDGAAYPTLGGQSLYPSQLAAGGSMCGCPHTHVKAAWNGAKAWFWFDTSYNALKGYLGCRNIGGHVWGHWDGAKLVFENGLEVEVYPDGFARSNRSSVTFGPTDTRHSSGYRTATFAVAIPLSALGVAPDGVEGKTMKFNVCCHNEDHRISAWGWRPKGKDFLTGKLEFRK